MLKFFIILILFNHLEIYKADEGVEECSVGNLAEIAEKSSSFDVDVYYFKVENTKNIKDASITMCDGSDFVEMEIEKDFVGAKVKNVDGLEESFENSKNSKIICFNVYMDCKNTNQVVYHLFHDTNNHAPSFINGNGEETTEYTFTLPMPFPGTVPLDVFGEQIRAKDIDFTNLDMTFEIKALDGEDDLRIEYGTIEPKMKKIHTAVLKSTRSLNFDERKYKLTATDAGNPSRSTTAILTVKKNKENSVVYPAFEKTYYKGFYDTQENTIVGLSAINLLDAEGAQVSLEEDEFRENFVLAYNDGVVGIEVGRPLEDVEDNVIVLSLDASVKNQVRPAKTVVVLEITGRTTTPTDKPAIVKFIDYSVEFSFNQNDKIPTNINTFLATSTDPRDSIIYKPVSFPTGLAVDPKSGVFSVVSDVESGKHRLEIEAVGSYSGQKDTAQFVLTVGSTITCESEEQTAYSFLVRKITEEQPTDTVVIAPENEEYEYCIFNQYPNNGKFYVNKDTKNVECEYLDREDKVFKDMAIPQYSLILKLQKRSEDGKCVEETQSYKSDWEFIEGINMYEKIKNSPTQTVINVVIEDINDHSPVFEKDEITVCYPEKDIAQEIRPTYLTKVFATDEDAIESTFGVVKYSSESSEVIVREDGDIYPTDSIYSKGDKFEFVVVATDGGGKTGKQKIKVKIIEDENIGILTLPNVPMDKVEEELEKLSKESNLDIRMLSSAGVPYKNARNTRSNFYQQVYIYGLKNNDPVGIKDVKEKLENAEIEKYESSSKEIIEKEAKVTGWIAAVSVLSVLLVIVLCGGIAFWYIKLRNKTSPYDTFENKVADPDTLDDKESLEGTKRGTRRQTGYVYNPPPAEEEPDNTYSTVDYGNTKVEPTSYDNQLYQSEDELKERRKSVSFNDQIERIKISKTEPSNDDEDEEKGKEKADL